MPPQLTNPVHRASLAGTLLLLVAGAICAAPADTPPVSNDTFDDAVDLAQLGWQVHADRLQSVWRVRDGHLQAVCHRNPYKGGRISKPVGKLERGLLEFDAKFATAGGANYGHLSLGFKLYGHMTAFKKYGGHNWMAYRAKGNSWTTLTKDVPLNQWVRIRFLFDAPSRRAEYYCGDMDDPVYVDDTFEFPQEGKEELEFFNYGLCNGTVTHDLDNIVLRSLAPASDTNAATARNRVLLFRGIAYGPYGVEQALAPDVTADRISVYTMQTRGAAVMPRNQFALDRVPSAKHMREAARILFIDVPAEPANCLPEFLLSDIEQAVSNGAHLIVFGGMFAFGKGGYQNTILKQMLPVQISGVWDVTRAPAPLPLRPCTNDWLLDAGGAAPAVLWLHTATLRTEAVDRLVDASDRPLVIRGTYGQGRVTVFLGTVCGDPVEFRKTDSTPFWQWPGWPAFVRQVVDTDGLAD